MAEPGDVVDVPAVGLRFEFRETAGSTGGAYTEFDVVGRPKGFLKSPHAHPGQTETHTVIEGSMRVRFHGRTHVLHAGDSITVPPGARHPGASTPPPPAPRHTQLPHGAGQGRIRVRLQPSGDVDAFLERLGHI